MTKLDFKICGLLINYDETIVLSDDHGNIYSYDYLSRKSKIDFKVCDQPIRILKFLPDNNLIAVDTEAKISIIDKTVNRIAKSILLSYYNDSSMNITNIIVMSNGNLILCTEYFGEHKLISLKFPSRALRYHDLWAIFDALEKNQSVTSINISNIQLSKSEIETILHVISNMRNDITIYR